MGLIPPKADMKKFSDDHPFQSLFYIAVLGFTVVDVMSSFTLPRGQGPFSTYRGRLPNPVSTFTSDTKGLSGSTSTTTSTSTSHPPSVVRERLIQHGTYGQLNGLGVSTSTTTSTSSSHLPPSLRRRLMARTLETEVGGSHLGKQVLSETDAEKEGSSFGSMYGLDGLTPETGSGWTE